MRILLLLGFVLAVATSARAEMLKGPQIKDLFTDATVAGNYVDGKPFSEYHSPDGRALGDNGRAINVDACWNVDGDNACYHYGPYKDRKTYCFSVEKQGDQYLLSVADNGRLNAIATVIKGNPNQHGDGGRRWSCDDLLAARAPLRFARN